MNTSLADFYDFGETKSHAVKRLFREVTSSVIYLSGVIN